MSLGNTGQTIPAQNVHVERAGVELILVSDVKVLGGRHTIDTLNTRAAPIDSYQWRVQEIEVTAAWTEDLQTQVEADNQLNSRSALSFNNWRVNGLNIGGSVPNDTDDTYSAGLYDYSVNGPPTGTSTISIKLRILRTAT